MTEIEDEYEEEEEVITQGERIVRERRTLLATQLELLGPSGKLGVILRYLGEEIKRQTRQSYDILADVYGEYDEEEIPMAEDNNSFPIGWVFDGLSSGIHLELIYLDESKTLSAYFKGYKVFEEESGSLRCFVPDEAWLSIVEKLFAIASQKRKKIHRHNHLLEMEMQKRSEMSLMQKLKIKWGF